MAQSKSQLNTLLKSLIAVEKSLPTTLSERWAGLQRRNIAATLRRMSVLSLLAQELLFQQTSSPGITSSLPSSCNLPSLPLPSRLLPSPSLSSSLAPLTASSSSPPSSCTSTFSLSPPPPPPSSSSFSGSSSSSAFMLSAASPLPPASSSSSSSLPLRPLTSPSSSSCLPLPSPPSSSSSSSSSLPLRPLPSLPSVLPSAVLLCFRELKNTTEKLKLLIKSFEDKSSIWQVLEHESLSHALHKLNHDIANALDILPLHLLQVSKDIIEQIRLVHSHIRRSQEPLIDPIIRAVRDKILVLIHEDLNENDISGMHDLFKCLHLRTFADCEREVELLMNEMNMQAGTGGIPVLCTIKNLIGFVRHAQCLLYGSTNVTHADFPRLSCSIYPEDLSISSVATSALLDAPTIPDEFRCPISLDLMHDPVVIATGHTYDRTSISKWLDSGHLTCPRSGQRLLHVNFIPNIALRRMIYQWCIEHSIQYDTAEALSNEENEDHISSHQAALEMTKETVAYLVGKLATGSLDVQRQVAYELRLLTKCGIENRICVAEAGAIPFLVPLLTSSDRKTQENAVTALLNLSICENNKSLIMAVGALDAVVEVVRAGEAMEARENSAATLFSLSVVNEYKEAIGAKPGAIPALVTLMREGSSRGKKDAAKALLNLCMFMENKAKVVEAGAIPVLINLLTDERACVTDDSLQVLAALADNGCGCVAISNQAEAIIPVLVELLRVGSARGKENAIAVLLALCKKGGDNVVRSVYSMNSALPSLESIVELGTARAKRRASALLTLIHKQLRHNKFSPQQ